MGRTYNRTRNDEKCASLGCMKNGVDQSSQIDVSREVQKLNADKPLNSQFNRP